MAPPPSLKKIKVFIARAEELDRDRGNPESRVVAYNLRQYAVLQGIPLANDAAAKAYLGELLTSLETEKEAMSVFSKPEHWKICRKIANKVFDKADEEDRAGMANKGTAKSFYAAGTFYEILQQFYEKEGEEEDDETKEQKEEEEQRRLYCKWKATEILNAIKEGRTPTPGGYQQEEEDDEYGGLPSISDGMPSINEDLPPPAPESNMQFFEPVDNLSPPPPAYDGVELNLNGDPTPTVEEVNEGDENSGDEDIFIPGAAKAAAAIFSGGNLFVDEPSPVDNPPPPYSAMSHQPAATTPSIPPPAATRPLPPIPAPAPAASNASTGLFSSVFGGNKSSGSTKLSRDQMADAVELTKFALAALQKGDGDLGRERLEQALGLWRR